MLQRIRDFEWTFSNTAEGALAVLLTSAIVVSMFA